MIEIIGFFTILARLQEISHTLSLTITEILSYSSHPSAQRQDRDGSGVGATSPLLAGVPLSSSSFKSPAWGGPEVYMDRIPPKACSRRGMGGSVEHVAGQLLLGFLQDRYRMASH
jgi:hypothetical protein